MPKQLRTHTDYDFQRMKELQQVAGRTFGRKEAMRKRAFSFVGGFLFLMAGAILSNQSGDVFLPVFLRVVGALLLVWGVFFDQISAWTAGKNMNGKGKSNDFVLEKKDILAFSGNDSTRYPYTDCLDLLETERTIYFLMKNGQGLLLDKSNLEGGSAADLRAWLEEKCGKKVKWVGRHRAP